jgi:hypothetical protein
MDSITLHAGLEYLSRDNGYDADNRTAEAVKEATKELLRRQYLH